MSKTLDDLQKWLAKQAKENAELDDWSDGDPRAKSDDVIEIAENIDYDPENAFWIAELRRKGKTITTPES